MNLGWWDAIKYICHFIDTPLNINDIGHWEKNKCTKKLALNLTKLNICLMKQQ